MEQTKLVEFKHGDDLVAVELKYKFDEDRLYFLDEEKNDWVQMNVSAMIERDLMTVKNPAALLK